MVCQQHQSDVVGRKVASLRSCSLLTVGLAVCIFGGCGYMVGPAHDLAVTSVEVPVFKNETYRRGLEEMLTEAVQKEIQQRTAMRLVRGPGAQTRLTGRITGVTKSLLGRTMNDDARELQLDMQVEVTWTDLRSGRVLHQDTVALNQATVPLHTQGAFAPEIGHSQATATDDVIHLTARKIVDLMDLAW